MVGEPEQVVVDDLDDRDVGADGLEREFEAGLDLTCDVLGQRDRAVDLPGRRLSDRERHGQARRGAGRPLAREDGVVDARHDAGHVGQRAHVGAAALKETDRHLLGEGPFALRHSIPRCSV